MAVLIPLVVEAQSPPRPSVSVSQLPRFSDNNKVADFNEDGRADLIGGARLIGPPATDLVIALGAGDGTFAPPASLGVPGSPLAVADFNNDGHQDVLVGTIAILPGRGNGTFGALRQMPATPSVPLDPEFPYATIAADFNNDGKVDLLLGSSLYPGHGDFTFGAPYELSAASGYVAAFADFNRDGRSDLAVLRPFAPIDVLLNQGGFLFAVAPPVTLSLNSIQNLVAGDLNKDGNPDLIAITSYTSESGESPGDVHVMLGNGDGTFDADVTYPIGVGGRTATVTVAVGDFNRDGNLDVASGGQSARYYDSFCTGRVLWDSVSIVPGRGDGTLGTQASFRLGTNNYTDEEYQLTHHALVSGDLNGDGYFDLVTSPGAVLLGRPAVPNRAPQVSAGPDQTTQGSTDIPLDGSATDADNDWLRFQWRNQHGVLSGNVPLLCGSGGGTYTLTVTDDRGGTASDTMTIVQSPSNGNSDAYMVVGPGRDAVLGTATPHVITWTSNMDRFGVRSFRVRASVDDGKTWTTVPGCAAMPATATQCTWTAPGPVTATGRFLVEAYNATGGLIYFATSPQFRIISGRGTVPGWQNSDIGAVGVPGSVSYDGSIVTVKGSGADIWDSHDQFHYVWTVVAGDFELIAHVNSVQNVDRWTKAGLMIRNGVGSTAPHASLFATPTTEKGLAFQRRRVAGGPSVSTPGPSIAGPVWLRLVRAADQVSAYYRLNTASPWTLIGTDTLTAPGGVSIGLAVSSHVRSTLATATFDHLQYVPREPLVAGWSSNDVGSPGAAGSTRFSDFGAATVTGSGGDVWGAADAFHWVHRSATGDFTFEAHVDRVDNVDRWTKAGLMIRAGIGPSAQHAFIFSTPTVDKGVAFQGRQVAGGLSTQVQSVAATAPVYLRITRQGSTINAFMRPSMARGWLHMGTLVLAGLPEMVEVGLAVTSHRDGALAAARFSNIVLEPIRAWSTSVIGPGSGRSFVNGTFFSGFNTGRDIWGTADDFTYIHTRWQGDGTMTARLNQIITADQWSKAGLMFRESLAPGSKFVYALSSSSKGSALQYRGTTGGAAASAGAVPGRSAPGEFEPGFWLRITRAGSRFSSWYSTDFISWIPLGEVTIAMPGDIYIGIAVTSHNPAGEAVGQFDDVTVRRDPWVPEAVPGGSF